jgi:zinc transport system substrate-binding protein
MGKEIRVAVRVLFWVVAGMLLVPGCRRQAETGHPRVVCSLFPLYEFARAVGGDRAEVSLLLPPGVEPHAWEPRARDLVAIAQADLFLCVSRNLEPWAQDVVQGASRQGLRLIVAAEMIGLPDEESRDPHIWLDLVYDQEIVEGIARVLASIDPDRADLYRDNAGSYKRKLEAIDREYEAGLASCRHRTLVLGGHSAFSYLARRYGLEQIPLYGVSADAEPTPQRLAEVVALARKRQLKYVFFETLVSPKLAEVVAEEIGARTLPLNPGANLTKGQLEEGVTFLAILEENLRNLRKGLACDG